MEKQTIGKFIAALRKANGMTQQELADKLNMSNRSISKWECDDGYPDLSLIPVIAEIFNVTADEILKGARIVKTDGPEAASDSPPQKSEKQFNYLVQRTLARFKNLSFIAIGICILSASFILVPALTQNFIGALPTLCLYFSVSCSIAGIVAQIIFRSRASSALMITAVTEETDTRLLKAARTVRNYTFNIITANAVIFALGVSLALNDSVFLMFLIAALPLTMIAYVIKAFTDKRYYGPEEQGATKKAETARAEKRAVIIVYSLLLIISVIYLIYGGIHKGAVTQFIIPFAIFVIFTAAQVIVFHSNKSFGKPQFIIMLSLAIVKAQLVLGTEFALDIFWNMYFDSYDRTIYSLLMISFMVSAAAAAVVEIITLCRINKRAAAGNNIDTNETAINNVTG